MQWFFTGSSIVQIILFDRYLIAKTVRDILDDFGADRKLFNKISNFRYIK